MTRFAAIAAAFINRLTGFLRQGSRQGSLDSSPRTPPERAR